MPKTIIQINMFSAYEKEFTIRRVPMESGKE